MILIVKPGQFTLSMVRKCFFPVQLFCSISPKFNVWVYIYNAIRLIYAIFNYLINLLHHRYCTVRHTYVDDNVLTSDISAPAATM